MVASQAPPTGDLARNPGMWPDWESNWRPVGSQPALSPLSQASQGWSILSISSDLFRYRSAIFLLWKQVKHYG